jgi:hypothetical protein
MLKKILNGLTVLSLIAFLVGAFMLWYKPFTGINNLDFTLFSFVLSFSAFTIQLFIGNAQTHALIKWSVLVLLLIPLLLTFSALYEPNVLEKSWPLLISMVVFQSVISFLSLLDFFNKENSVSMFPKFIITYAILICVASMIIILLKIPNAFFYTLLLFGIILLLAFYLIYIMLQKKS